MKDAEYAAHSPARPSAAISNSPRMMAWARRVHLLGGASNTRLPSLRRITSVPLDAHWRASASAPGPPRCVARMLAADDDGDASHARRIHAAERHREVVRAAGIRRRPGGLGQ